MSVLAARRLALPRVRLRRPKPRPPLWWLRVALCIGSGAAAVFNTALGNHVTVAGCALSFADNWRHLARWPEDSLAGAPIDTTSRLLANGGFALVVLGIGL